MPNLPYNLFKIESNFPKSQDLQLIMDDALNAISKIQHDFYKNLFLEYLPEALVKAVDSHPITSPVSSVCMLMLHEFGFMLRADPNTTTVEFIWQLDLKTPPLTLGTTKLIYKTPKLYVEATCQKKAITDLVVHPHDRRLLGYERLFLSADAGFAQVFGALRASPCSPACDHAPFAEQRASKIGLTASVDQVSKPSSASGPKAC